MFRKSAYKWVQKLPEGDSLTRIDCIEQQLLCCTHVYACVCIKSFVVRVCICHRNEVPIILLCYSYYIGTLLRRHWNVNKKRIFFLRLPFFSSFYVLAIKTMIWTNLTPPMYYYKKPVFQRKLSFKVTI